MIGTLKPGLRNAPKAMRRSYRAVYCSLCRALRRDYGPIGCAFLNHEITELLALILAQQPEAPVIRTGLCSVCAVRPVPLVDHLTDVHRAAACACVMIAGGEVMDNAKDQGGLWRPAASALAPIMGRARRLLPGMTDAQRGALARYNAVEDAQTGFEPLLRACGRLSREMLQPLVSFAPPEGWEPLGDLSEHLGAWLSLVDACRDYADDRRRGRRNMLFDEKDPVAAASDVLGALEADIANALGGMPLAREEALFEHLFLRRVPEIDRDALERLKNGG